MKPTLYFLYLSLITFTICNSSHFLSEPPSNDLNLRSLKLNERRAGVLLHITSLPSKYGIGSLGEEAYKFIDFLERGKQKLWHILPIHPTIDANSPFHALSTFAGNPNLIDLDMLVQEKLISQDEINKIDWGDNPSKVDFPKVYEKRQKILRKAYLKFQTQAKDVTDNYKEYLEFSEKQKWWLMDFTLFMAIKDRFKHTPWSSWPNEYKFKKTEALEEVKQQLKLSNEYHSFLQFYFDKQWKKLKQYANSKGIQLIGDVPIYVPLDSVDSWSHPEVFMFDDKRNPIGVAGYPPDEDNKDGQLWGYPLYDWENLKKDNYSWLIKRLRAHGDKFDILRINHFRALESFWFVPYGETTARNGYWMKGPGIEFINVLRQELPHIKFIAENLGHLSPEATELISASGIPGMRVLTYAFDETQTSIHLPHRYKRNSVCYTGTYDHEPIMSWQHTLTDDERTIAEKYLGVSPGTSLVWPLIQAGLNSLADTFIVQYQDYLSLGSESRMNTPGKVDNNNWVWRTTLDHFSDQLANDMAAITCEAGRCEE